MNTPTADTFAGRRDREVRTITAVISAVCLVSAAAAIVPGVEHAINLALIALGALVALTVAVRFGLRRLRERREDRADEITAAARRAAHPHPHPHTDTRAGVA